MPHLLFPTAFGTCALAWNEAGLTGFQLPEETEALTEERIAAKSPSTGGSPPPLWVAELVDRVQRHLDGKLQDFTDARIAWSKVGQFQEAVLKRTLEIKAGSVRTYGEIARSLALGPEAARAVGVALANNPWPLVVPCHRVVAAGGKMTGFSAPGGIRTKTRLLALEGAELLSE